MRYFRYAIQLITILVIALAIAGCDVPQPPVEALTPTVAAPDDISGDYVPQAGSTPTVPSFDAPAQGHIWFLRGDNLWVLPIDGETDGEVRKMSDRKVTLPPAPSPDGKRVAIVSDRDIYILDANSGAEKLLIRADLTDRQIISWSPDGKLISYFTFDMTNYGTEYVWQIGADGGEPEQLTTVQVRGYQRGSSFTRSARWAPDMRRIAVSTIYGPIQILSRSQTAGDNQTVGGGEPDWAPGSRTMLYAETLSGAIALYDVISKEPSPYRSEKREVGTRMGEFGQGPGPRFNPSGSLIVYRSQTGDGRPAVAIRSVGGDEVLFVPGNNAEWSPYDGWLVYESGAIAKTAEGDQWQPDGIEIINADGADQRQLIKDARLPVWGR